MRKETKYYHELEDGREVELPFDTEHADITEVQKGDKIVLGCIVRDLDPDDPLEEFDEGELVQFDLDYKHYGPRPDVEDFESIIRENKGRVFFVSTMRGGYAISHLALIKNASDIEDADGYYIAPQDVKSGRQALRYADGALEQYTAWCEGDAWGVCVWTYDAQTLELEDRDECWGYYGADYAESEMLAKTQTINT